MNPTLLFYCQHSMGMGHLVRSMALAEGLSRRFRVVFVSGGARPEGWHTPTGIEWIQLPPLELSGGALVAGAAGHSLSRVQASRVATLRRLALTLRPEVVLVELFPFGRKKFAFELVPFLELARERPERPLVLSSLRDILVRRPEAQEEHDERARAWAQRYFDGVLVHSDPSFARLEETFQPFRPLQTAIHYTGFVVPADARPRSTLDATRRRQVLVSAGGGRFGFPLFQAALEAHERLFNEHDTTMKIVGGPFLPARHWQSLRHETRSLSGVTVIRSVPNVCAEMRASAASVSQCGYNTALDILRSGVSAVVVPFAEGRESEQCARAQRLQQRRALRVLDPGRLEPGRLAAEIRALFSFRPSFVRLDLDGTQNTVRIVEALLGAHVRNRHDRLAGASSPSA